MIKYLTKAIIFLTFCSVTAQDFSSLWQGYFSFNNVNDITQGDNKIFVASDNVIFTYDLTTNLIETITTIDGLSGQTITTIEYSELYNRLLIGYQNGLIEIIDFENDNEILTIVDILDKETISPARKRINHFNEHNGLIYISTNYGISVYDITRLEFGDTYFIGNAGSQVIVKQTTVFNNFIYAACTNNNAVKKADLLSANLIDFQQWQTLNNGNFESIQIVENQLYAIKTNNTLYRITNDNFNALLTYPSLVLDTKEVNDNLVITINNTVYVYDSNFNLISTASTNAEFNTQFKCATITDEHIYIGTNSLGVLKTQLQNPLEYESILPEGPTLNNAFKIEAGSNELWVTYGDYTVSYNPNPMRSYGISHLVDEDWRNIPYDSLLNAVNLNYIAINPFNPSQVFISSFDRGLLELNNEVATTLYNQTNSGLESAIVPGAPNFITIRQTSSVFDRTGILWTLTGRVERPLKSYNLSTQQWIGYSFSDIISDPLNGDLGFSDLVIDSNGTKWIGANDNGVIGFSENGNQINRVYTAEQNMPDPKVRALAIDNRNQLWIGTFKGLRVLYNTGNFLNDPDPSVNEIVVLEDGIAQELLANQFITDIKVDGSNNKWIGTLDSGVFYFSPDGQNTIYHFTTDNSPLPSNTINDISIDQQTGIVYIATIRGLVSFNSGGSKTEEELDNAFVYPNPVRPEYNILGSNDLNDITKGVKIKGLTEKVNIKITDIEGNLVAEAQSGVNLRASSSRYNFAIDGGTAIWNGKNLGNNVVASGVYLIMISDLDTFETKVLKLLIIR
uniref:type IX secretion system anionic LPS delivery protein PorZ n=1 Tax=Gelidibacter sp. TaxID=2018083 RepID=UPI00404A5FE0